MRKSVATLLLKAGENVRALRRQRQAESVYTTVAMRSPESNWRDRPDRCSLQLNGLPSNCPPKQAISKLFFSALAA